jgi:hypothetical protein
MSLTLPELPDGLEWVINADHDRFTVHLSACPKKGTVVVEPEESSDDNDKTVSSGYIMSHTHRHSNSVMSHEDWETEVTNTAKHLLVCYEEGIRHAQWADEIVRRSR